MFAILLLPAMVLDALLGEPKWLWNRLPHPAIVMGRIVAALERHLNHGRQRKLKGVMTVVLLLALALGLGAVLARLPFAPVVEVILAAILLAQRSLVQHVQAVAAGLRLSLAQGRGAVAMIVGRDTAQLDESAVTRAAIESAAENLSDGVIAPAFWFLLAGLPGILAYKIINTADSMIGHRTERYEQFGWAAARLDDVLNLVPARLTALICLAVFWHPRGWAVVRRDAPRHRSPNAGWPEAAFAAVLGIALSGPRSYHGVLRDEAYVNPEGRRALGPADIDAAVGALWRVWGLTLVLVLAIALLR